MKAAFIVNPQAGRGKAKAIWKGLEPQLKIDCPYLLPALDEPAPGGGS